MHENTLNIGLQTDKKQFFCPKTKKKYKNPCGFAN